MGGGIFALRRPRPYSRHCEEIVGGGLPYRPSFVPHRLQWEGVEADNDAARRVATNAACANYAHADIYGNGVEARKRRVTLRRYSRHGEAGVAMYAASTIIYAKTGINGKAWRGITTRHAASLRPS